MALLLGLIAGGLITVLPPLSLPVHAQQRSQRLILKDGSYQSVVKYEMQGDRVHYLSAERYEWEDVPASLIDWDATNKYNNELSSGKLHTLVETPEEKEEREKEEANSPADRTGPEAARHRRRVSVRPVSRQARIGRDCAKRQ